MKEATEDFSLEAKKENNVRSFCPYLEHKGGRTAKVNGSNGKALRVSELFAISPKPDSLIRDLLASNHFL